MCRESVKSTSKEFCTSYARVTRSLYELWWKRSPLLGVPAMADRRSGRRGVYWMRALKQGGDIQALATGFRLGEHGATSSALTPGVSRMLARSRRVLSRSESR